MIKNIMNYIKARVPVLKLKKEIGKQTYPCRDCGGTKKINGINCPVCYGRGFHIK